MNISSLFLQWDSVPSRWHQLVEGQVVVEWSFCPADFSDDLLSLYHPTASYVSEKRNVSCSFPDGLSKESVLVV